MELAGWRPGATGKLSSMTDMPDSMLGHLFRLECDNRALRAQNAALRARVAELEGGGGEAGLVFRALGLMQTPASDEVRQCVKDLLKSMMGVIVTAHWFIGTTQPYHPLNVEAAAALLQRNMEICIPEDFVANLLSRIGGERWTARSDMNENR